MFVKKLKLSREMRKMNIAQWKEENPNWKEEIRKFIKECNKVRRL